MSGLKRRTVQLWAEGRVLIAEPATDRQGSGVHRTFSRDEAIICQILSRFAVWNLPIGQIGRIATILRVCILASAKTREDIEKCIMGRETCRLMLEGTAPTTGAIRLIVGVDDDDDGVLAEPLKRLNSASESLVAVVLDGALAVFRTEPKA